MDVVCFEDLDEFGRDLDDPVEELEQDIVHMLFESFGSNADATVSRMPCRAPPIRG